MKRFLLGSVAGLFIGGTAFASDVALIIGNGDYSSLRDLRGGEDVVAAADEFKALGFQVISREDSSRTELAVAAEQFERMSTEAERVLVVLSGRFVNSTRDTWLLPVDAPASPSLARVPRDALPLSTVLAVLEAHPGKAMILIADDDESGASANTYLRHGVGDVELPQGVTMLRGSARAIAGFAEAVLPLPAMSTTIEAARRQGLLVEGYAPNDYQFIGEKPATVSETTNALTDEVGVWEAARQIDTIAGYQQYISQFPEGDHLDEANGLIAEIQTEPNRADRLMEEAMGLGRDQRREVQRNLSILDFNPRGIDGIFGPGSRGAIKAWQAANGFDGTTYLTREQISRLDAQGIKRAAELEAEAERRRLEQERLDREYWQATGSAGDEPGLRAYLKRYPDGVFAEVAQNRLAVFEEQKRAAAAAQDRNAWDQVSSAGTLEAYREYLTAFPNGAFAEEAQAQIEALTAEQTNSKELKAAEQGEERLGLNVQTRTLIENRLTKLGLKPGLVDGVFDERTRRAIRRYQQAREINMTGYLSQETVVRLLADSILR